MNIALCYESVVPARGGCETYIADLVRRLLADRHEVHLYACHYDQAALSRGIVFHRVPSYHGPRFLRPWKFGAACEKTLALNRHDVVIGFVKTWRQDVLIPQGGLHVASVEHNLCKYGSPLMRIVARLGKLLDLSHWSYQRLERKQLTGEHRPLIVAPSAMVKEHLREYYGIGARRVRVVHNAIDPGRFVEANRLRLREELQVRLGVPVAAMVGLFVGHNYRLKGLDPLLHAVHALPNWVPFQLLVCGSSKIGRYRRLARRLGIEKKVHLLGFQKDVRPCFFAADFLIHPTFYDPCSLVVLEALACSLPVITTRYNGAAELLDPPHDGYVIDDPHDYHALAIRIEQLCDKAHRAERNQAARQAAAKWTFEDHYQALMGVLREAVKRKAAA
jgi:UDP-glucose:(heptosyl)LPS alpha-1,3-glucosyltransferase